MREECFLHEGSGVGFFSACEKHSGFLVKTLRISRSSFVRAYVYVRVDECVQECSHMRVYSQYACVGLATFHMHVRVCRYVQS